MRTVVFPILISLAAPALGQDPAREKQPESRPTGGAIQIEVVWKGERPPAKTAVIPESFKSLSPSGAEFCGRCVAEQKLRDESLVIGPKGGVANVAASLPALKVEKNTLARATLDNACCRFEPHVQFVPTGESIEVKNSDPLMHNARIRPVGGPAVWNAMVAPESSITGPKILRPGLYEVTCDAHSWMKAHLVATRNPFCAVTAEDGAGRIAHVPPGEGMTLVLWHETLGTARRVVDLKEGEVVRISLSQEDFRSK